MLIKIGKFFKLPLQTQWLLVKISVVLIAIHGSLRIFPFRSVYRFVSISRRAAHIKEHNRAAYEKRMVWAISRLSFHLLGKESCLRQALTGLYFFNRAGIPVSLRIGVKKGTGVSILAHAWLERNGEILLGGSDDLFNQFIRLPDLDPVILNSQAEVKQ